MEPSSDEVVRRFVRPFFRLVAAQLQPEDLPAQSEQAERRTAFRQTTRAAFFCDFNFRTGKIEAPEGLEPALGYPEELTFRRFLEIMHPSARIPYCLLGGCAYDIVSDLADDEIDALEFRIALPFLHANGRYFWFLQQTTTRTTDGQGFTTAVCNAFTVEGEWSPHERRFAHVFFVKNGQIASDLLLRLTDKIHSVLLGYLSPGEIVLLSHYAAGYTLDTVAKGTGLSRDTLRERNASILRKIRYYFGAHFDSAFDAAAHLSAWDVIVPIREFLPRFGS